jgi:hypothetical protein
MASCSDAYSITVEAATVSGQNNTLLSSPHLIQYPRPPRNDSGKFAALGSALGALIGRMANSGRLSAASDAEDKWRTLNDKLYDRGEKEWLYGDDQRTLAGQIDVRIRDRDDKGFLRSDHEYDRAVSLEECNDALHERLCAYALCGYRADYQGIMNRIRAETNIQLESRIREMKEHADRYNTGVNADVFCDMQRAAMLTSVMASTKAFEDERQFMWKINNELIFRAADTVEKHRSNRLLDGQRYEQLSLQLEMQRQRTADENSMQHVQMGGQFLTGAGQNYAWLAESLRRTAQLDGQDFATLGALAGIFLPKLFSGCAFATPDNCGCCTAAAASAAQTEAACTGMGGIWTPTLSLDGLGTCACAA